MKTENTVLIVGLSLIVLAILITLVGPAFMPMLHGGYMFHGCW